MSRQLLVIYVLLLVLLFTVIGLLDILFVVTK